MTTATPGTVAATSHSQLRAGWGGGAGGGIVKGGMLGCVDRTTSERGAISPEAITLSTSGFATRGFRGSGAASGATSISGSSSSDG